MSITYPRPLPSAPGFTDTAFRLRRIQGVSASPFTGSEQILAHAGAWWEADISLPPMKREKAAEWCAWLASLRGRVGTFLLGDPDAKQPRGVATGSAFVTGGAAAGATTLPTAGWTPSTANILRAGDYIQIGTSGAISLHMVVEDANSDGSGAATLSIEPALRTAVTGGAVLVTSNPCGLFHLAASDVEWRADRLALFGVTFTAREAL